jgi:hypothetical protein
MHISGLQPFIFHITKPNAMHWALLFMPFRQDKLIFNKAKHKEWDIYVLQPR